MFECDGFVDFHTTTHWPQSCVAHRQLTGNILPPSTTSYSLHPWIVCRAFKGKARTPLPLPFDARHTISMTTSFANKSHDMLLKASENVDLILIPAISTIITEPLSKWLDFFPISRYGGYIYIYNHCWMSLQILHHTIRSCFTLQRLLKQFSTCST